MESEHSPPKMYYKTSALLEARPYRPFKSGEEYLIAMKEDLAEWLQTMYAHLNINFENFMDKLESGVALCEHANAVKAQAQEYVEKKQTKTITRSTTSSLAQGQSIINLPDVKYFHPNIAKPGSFFARDNVSNFIKWCRDALNIMECLRFETDDLIMRKNEKHVILCLLEVARRGAKFGMLAPMLVQMEIQIDREIAADNKKLYNNTNDGLGYDQNGLDDDYDSDIEVEPPVLMYGPVPQIVTNDLKSLDEMVRDLVEKCTCPTQFPMIRVSEGKYRIGDTKVLIFVRILRNHVMVRVGGGWDTLAHYLDKHDPCRCRSQHRTTQGARHISKPGTMELHGSHVYYDRSKVPGVVQGANGTVYNATQSNTLGPPMNSLNRSRSKSPSHLSYGDNRRSVSPNFPRKSLAPPANRSRSPTPNFTSTHSTKLAASRITPNNKHLTNTSGPQSLPYFPTQVSDNINGYSKNTNTKNNHHITSLHIPVMKSEAVLQVNDLTDQSDTTSEMSDEGYRSLNVDKNKQRSSLYSQNSAEDVDDQEHRVLEDEDQDDKGLRKTKFSQKIYEPNDIKPKLKLEVNETPIKSTITSSQREKSFTRASSTDRRSSLEQKSKVLPPQAKKMSNKVSTWNGRQKSNRPSISNETFQTPNTFNRNSSGRRSSSAFSHRRSSSTNTSPTKTKFKDELLKTVQYVDDDSTMVQQLQELLKKYSSLNELDDVEEPQTSRFSRAEERMSIRSPRKDSRTESVSRIPAPISHKA